MLRFALAFPLLAVASVASAQPIDRTLVKPGLLFGTVALDEKVRQPSALVPFPALSLAAGERAHPNVPIAPYRWLGTLNVVQAGKYRFDLELLGEATVMLGDTVLVKGIVSEQKSVRVDGGDIELAAGIQKLSITLKSMPSGACFKLIWRGPGFQAEPIPYFFYGHLPTDGIDAGKANSTLDRGRYLVEEHGCVNCHREAKPTLTPRTGTNLTQIAARTNAGWLDGWLKNPHVLRPDTAMPAMFPDDETGAAERYAVVTYLMTLGEAREPSTVRGDEMKRSLEAGRKLYQTVGCSTCHGDKLTTAPTKAKKDDAEEEEKPALAPHELVYSLGDTTVGRFYLLGQVGSKWAVEPLTKYLLDPQTLNLHGRMPGMNLSPDEARDLARFLTRQTDDQLSQAMPAAPKQQPSDFGGQTWKAAGKAVFAAKGCVNCHAVDGKDAPLPKIAKPLAALSEAGGCLSSKPDAAVVPAYRFTAADRAAMLDFLQVGTGKDGSSPMYAAKASLKRFGCLNCHNKDGEGGLDEDLEKIMKSLSTAENGEDIVPPRLTHVGHKLRSSWMKAVLVNGQRARPWMGLRMPQYGETKVGQLVEGLPKLEGTTAEDAVTKPTYTTVAIEAGRKLTGKEGMGCIACHDIAGIAGGGTRGPDLAKTQDRVRRDWFSRWMHQPQRLAPGTKMPQNFIDGKSLFPSVLDGDADRQIDALWAYHSLGAGLPLPAGMEPPKGLIVTVGTKPEILRTFMPDDAGTRPIAIGFPGGINAAFDSASCRLTYAWAGNFLDATPVWNNRGGGAAKLLGPKFWSGSAGFPWAVAPDGVVPNFAKQFADPAFGHQLKDDSYGAGPRYVRFRTYEVDAAGNPSFVYALQAPDDKLQLLVTEKLEALPVSVAPGLQRSFFVKPATSDATWLYVGKSAKEPRLLSADGKPAKGEHGEVKAAGTRAILVEAGERVTVIDAVAVPAGAEWHTADGALLLRLPPSRGTATIVLKLWGLPKDEPALLGGLK